MDFVVDELVSGGAEIVNVADDFVVFFVGDVLKIAELDGEDVTYRVLE